jgi:hypothetical protein
MRTLGRTRSDRGRTALRFNSLPPFSGGGVNNGMAQILGCAKVTNNSQLIESKACPTKKSWSDRVGQRNLLNLKVVSDRPTCPTKEY